MVELLVVMGIILILAGLATYAGVALIKEGSRKRATVEYQAISAALENYKADNGTYPISDGVLLTNNYTSDDGTTANGEYQINSAIIYNALAGQASYSSPPTAGTKVYLPFKANEVGNPTGATSYVKDPWGASYGYSTGTLTTYPYTGQGLFDIWSCGGVTKTQLGANTSLTNAWIANWMQ
jgi:type II secretory pathway pseudopilin PulG